MKSKLFTVLVIIIPVHFANALIASKCSIDKNGITSCKAMESNINVMNMQCKTNGESTVCSGDYTDKQKSSLNMNCSHQGANINCSGATGDGTKFYMQCFNRQPKLKCNIMDNLGESMVMDCTLGKNGIPLCFGADNTGTNYKVSCTGDATKSTSCIAI